MRRSLSARTGVALLAVAFFLVVNGPAALYQCPAHSPRAASSPTAALHHAAHAGHSAPDQKAPHCTCGGTCCCCPPAAGLPVASAGAQWLPSVRAAVAGPGHHAIHPTGRSLPFATGPPHSA